MVEITINGVKHSVEKGITIVEAAKKIGIDIPTLCYDKRLGPYGLCKICVVEVEGMKNLVPSCVFKVKEGMVIETHSDRVIEERRNILNKMISNHPLDCLTCEKAGNCRLQDYCYEYGIKEGTLEKEEDKAYPIDESNHFFYYDPNKCILCAKCVRTCSKLQCSEAIELKNPKKGIVTKILNTSENGEESSPCVSCGNCVSVCPVGAMMPKKKEKYRYWEVERVQTTCSYCGVGCQMNLLVKDNKVVEVEPAKEGPNDGLLCVKGKFGYKFINHPDRLKTPLIKRDGKFEEATWEEAYEFIAEKTNETKEKYGPDVFAGLTSARCSNEENYLFQKLFRAVIGTNNIDHCARL